MKRIWIVFFLFIFFKTDLFAQDSLQISYSKSVALRYSAESLIKHLSERLNFISYSENEIIEIDSAVMRTYKTGDRDQLFIDKDVFIESDLIPLDYSNEKGQDVSVKKYLEDFNLFYIKSENDNVAFSNITASKLKYKSYPYYNIYFDCIFKGKHKSDTMKEYFPVHRIAEAKVLQRDSDFYVLISGISFTKNNFETDTLNDFKNFTLKNSNDSLLSIALRDAQKEKELRERKIYETILTEADDYFRKQDWNNALTAYYKAKVQNPYGKEAKDGIKKCEEQLRLAKEKKEADEKKKKEIEELKVNANNLYKQRRFIEAKEILDRLSTLEPDDASITNKLVETNYLLPKLVQINTQYNLGKFEEAIKLCDQFIASKELPEFYFLKAKFLWKKDSISKTSRVFENLELAIAKANNNYPEAQLERARIYLKSGTEKLADAIGDYSNLIAFYPDNAQYLFLRAKASENSLQEEALKDYTKAVQLKPADAEMFFKKGLLEYYLAKYNQSLSSFDSVLAVEKNNADACYYKGLNYEKSNDCINAGKWFYKAKANHIDTEKINTITALSRKHFDLGKTTMTSDYKTAVQLFSNSILIDTNADAIFQRAFSFYMLYKLQDAVNDFDLLNKLQTAYPNGWYYKGVCHQLLNDKETALSDYYKETEYHADNLNAQLALGKLNAELKHYDQAAISFEKAFKLSENDTLLYQIGINYYLAKSYSRAIDYLSQSIRSKSEVNKYFYRGMSYFNNNQFEEAVTDFKRTLELQANYPQAHRYLGKSYYNSKEYEKALTAFELAKNDESSIAENYYYYAHCCFNLKINFQKIYSDLLDAKRMDSASYNTSNTYALIAYGRLCTGSDSSYYMSNLNDAAQLNSNDPMIDYVKACIFARLNNITETYAALNKALAKGDFERSEIIMEPCFAELKRTKEFDALLDKYFKK